MRYASRSALPLLPFALLTQLSTAPGEPSAPHFSDDNTVLVEVTGPVDDAALRRILSDPEQRVRLSARVLQVDVLGKDGACTLLRTQIEGLTGPMTYDSRACPTRDGWVDTLVSSPDLEAYESSWILRASDQGTHIEFRCRVILRAAIPDSLVARAQASSMVDAVRRLMRKVLP